MQLITGYHGTDATFKKFDYTKITLHGAEHGAGLYFTEDKQTAMAYGTTILKATFKIHNPFNANAITITPDQLSQFIKTIDPHGDGLLSDFNDVAFYGYNKVLHEAVSSYFNYNNNDVDIISEILSYSAIRAEAPCKIFDNIYKIFRKDYIYYNSKDFNGKEIANYIIFSNNQIIKLAEV